MSDLQFLFINVVSHAAALDAAGCKCHRVSPPPLQMAQAPKAGAPGVSTQPAIMKPTEEPPAYTQLQAQVQLTLTCHPRVFSVRDLMQKKKFQFSFLSNLSVLPAWLPLEDLVFGAEVRVIWLRDIFIVNPCVCVCAGPVARSSRAVAAAGGAGEEGGGAGPAGARDAVAQSVRRSDSKNALSTTLRSVE